MPIDVEDTDVGTVRAHVIDDLAGGRFAHDEVVLLVLATVHRVDERANAKRIVLRGDREACLMALARVMLLEHVGLFDDLPRIGEELVSLVGRRDAAVGAREDPDAKLALELLDRNREIRLPMRTCALPQRSWTRSRLLR